MSLRIENTYLFKFNRAEIRTQLLNCLHIDSAICQPTSHYQTLKQPKYFLLTQGNACKYLSTYVSLSTSMMFIIQAHCTSIALHPNISSANWCSNFLTFCSTHEKGKKLVRLRSLKQFLCFHFIKHTGHIVFITWFQQHNGFFCVFYFK